ncbi:MAG: diguanylate cyclase [Nitrospirae bacterium]|nr:diguanylate cyclase [Nitrospirota bacterium]
MTLSKKFDVYMAVITIVFAIALAVSYNAVTLISNKMSALIDISHEFDYLTQLKHTLIDLEHAVEHFMHILPGKGYSEDVKKGLAELERALRFSENVKLDDDEKGVIGFAREHFSDFALTVNWLIKEGETPDEKKTRLYQQWKENYLDKIRDQIDRHWKEDLKRVGGMSIAAGAEKDRSLRILSLLSAGMFLILAAARLFVSRTIVRPLKTVEGVSTSIANGDTARRIEIASRDEMGSLSTSINSMAAAIEDKIKALNASVEKEQAVVREQTILNELMGFIVSGIDIERVLDIFLGRTRDLLKAEHAGIFILENRGKTQAPELKIFHSTFEKNTSPECAKSMLNGVFRTALKTMEPVRINALPGEAPPTHLEMRNMIAVPLSSVDEHLLGLIVLVNKEGGFSQEDEDILFGFSFQAFQAITMQQEILDHARKDGLTGLYNHRIFMEALSEELERSKRYSHCLALLMIDIDHFKTFNDLYGHQSGDVVLAKVAELVSCSVRSTDFGARYGGEEFSVILPETTGAQAVVVAERIRDNIGRHSFILKNNESVHVTVSIGYAAYPDDADMPDILIKRADQGLYMAKEKGRNRVCRYTHPLFKTEEKTPDQADDVLSDVSITSIKELAKAIDSKSQYMKGHSFQVAELAVRIGKQLGLNDAQVEGLRIASLLHDVGNLSIPDNILNKTGPLTTEEKKIIQGHPGLSEVLLKHYAQSESILPAILYHHERFDGRGYPLGLKGNEIPLQAKILGAVEAYLAMVSDRPYREKKNRSEAIAEIEAEAGQQFDPLIARMLANVLKKEDKNTTSPLPLT